MIDRVFDILIKDGELIDGLGTPRYKSDLGIEKDKIVAIGKLSHAKARKTINAKNLIVSPGFIDVHTHDDNLIFHDRSMKPKTSQGVTSVIVGNCGISLAPLILNKDKVPPPPQDLLGDRESYIYPTFADYRTSIEKRPPATNVGFSLGIKKYIIAAGMT